MSRGTGLSNVILGLRGYLGTIRGGKFDFKTEMGIVKYSRLVWRYVPLPAQPLIFFTNKTVNINVEKLL